MVRHSPERGDTWYATVRQYSLVEILAVWAAAAVPMGVLAWVVAPWLEDQLGGAEPLTRALLLLLTVGLIWQFVLVVVLMWRELGSLQWARVRDALWLRAPRDPMTGRVGGRVWWWLLPFVVLLALEEALPGFTGPVSRDFGELLATDRGEELFRGAWGWFAVVVVLAVFNTVLGEELLFRGVLLPRMRGVFGRWDWVVNGILFATYHLHVPWEIGPPGPVAAAGLAPARRQASRRSGRRGGSPRR
jgi:membrane protease YdiL (CAAX protease family)